MPDFEWFQFKYSGLFLGIILTVLACSNGSESPPSQSQPAAAPLTQESELEVRSITMDEVEAAFQSIDLPTFSATKPSLLILGLDGLTPYFFEPLRRQGKLPVLDSLMRTGTHGPLVSSIIPSSVVAWTTASTGYLPEEHGMTSFFISREDGELGLINTTYRTRKALWELASEQDRSSIIINVPGSYPPDPIKGIIISGLLAPRDKTFTHPATLSPLLRSLAYYTTHKPLSHLIKVGSNPFSEQTATGNLDDLFTITFNRAKIGLYLYQHQQVDLFYIVFTLLDRLQHSRHLIPGEILDSALENLDAIVGEFLKLKLPETPVLIYSDHGFKEYRKGFAVNYWLAARHLTTNPEHLESQAQRVSVVDVVGNYFTLRINVQGREKNGTVKPETKNALLASLKRELLAEVDPWTRQPAVSQVIIRSEEELARCPYMADMIVELTKDYLATSSREPQGTYLELQPPIFDHEREGYFIVSGPGIKSSQVTLNIQDMAATALYLLDLPLPTDLAGRVPEEAFEATRLAEKPPKRVTLDTRRTARNHEPNPPQEQEVIEYLQSLGYTK